MTEPSLCAMGRSSVSTTVLPEMLTPPVNASATSASLPPSGVASTVKAELAGTEFVFSGSL